MAQRKNNRRPPRAIKIVTITAGSLLALAIALLVVGIISCGVYWQEYLSYPFAEVPVQLPRDHAAHSDFKTEWWYYTGHLDGNDGGCYGFQLTFFRIRTANLWYKWLPVWWFLYPHLIAAHIAITDVTDQRFYSAESIQERTSGNAGAKEDSYHVWLGNWFVLDTPAGHRLHAQDRHIGLDLILTPKKPPALHGEGGYLWKGVDGIPSYYISFTRMDAGGEIRIKEKTVNVTGQAWMDHEFTSFKPKHSTRGWNWFAIQLASGYDVMLYQMHRTDGSVSTDCTGTLVDPEGNTSSIAKPSYRIEETSFWTSPRTGVTYPVRWTVLLTDVPATLDVKALIPDQEMVMKDSKISYWEGACTVTGPWAGSPVTGKAYVELTGYEEIMSEKF